MRKLFGVLFVLLLIIVALPQVQSTSAQVPDRQQAVVCRETLTVFAAPRRDAMIIGNFVAGDVVDVITDRATSIVDRSSFSEVELNGLRGWVARPFLVDYPRIVFTNSPLVYMRSGPTVLDDVVAELEQDVSVELLAIDGRLRNGGLWFYVRVIETGQEGWISRVGLIHPRGVSSCQLPVIVTQTEPLAATIWTSGGAEIADDTPVWESNLITRPGYATRVTVLQLDGSIELSSRFSYVRIEATGQEGWIGTGYLEIFPFPVIALVDAATFDGPGGNSIGQLSAGDCVVVTDSLRREGAAIDAWFRVESADGVSLGWVDAEQLRQRVVSSEFFNQLLNKCD